ncbi:MAG: chorismate mutase [Jatrophihabitans sp.]|nr:MAG: chorismate mutase [Jatrophihabitans sp.]
MTTALEPDTDLDAAAGPQPGVDSVAVLRGQIDALDAAIARLVTERAALSRRVQATRMSNGGTRVELGRERVILATYRDALGRDGANLAEAVLRVCRGAR